MNTLAIIMQARELQEEADALGLGELGDLIVWCFIIKALEARSESTG